MLSNEWVPPITIAPTHISTSAETTDSPSRKKNSSVSFSLDSSSEAEPTAAQLPNNADTKEETDKATESRKNKVMFTHNYLKILYFLNFVHYLVAFVDVEETVVSAVMDGNIGR